MMRDHIDAPFRIALGAILLAIFVVRIYGHWQRFKRTGSGGSRVS
jgi:hypothetical protein